MKHNNQAFDQNIIALVWDFDKTLIRGYMQEPLFRKYKVDEGQFWSEVRALQDYYAEQGVQINNDSIYLNHLLTYIQHGPLKGLTNQDLRDLGAEMDFYPGLPDFLGEIQDLIENDSEFKRYDIKLEHYIVSTGFAETIRGSDIAPFVEDVWGCEFIEKPAQPGFLKGSPELELPEGITQIASALDNTSKTRALFEISKGANKVSEIDVNSKMNSQTRRVPFTNMIYIADGPSDVPAFSILNQFNGRTYAIFPPQDPVAFRQVDQLRKDGRINHFGEADYRTNTSTWMWLSEHARQIAQQIVRQKDELIRSSVSAPPKHL